MDGSARSAAANQKKPFVADNDLVELLWHNGSVVAHPQAHPRAPPSVRPSSSGLTGDETAAWFPNAFDDALEKELYTQMWYGSVADAATPHHSGCFPGPSSQPQPELARAPIGGGGVETGWTGDVCSTFCGSNQVFSAAPASKREDAAAFPAEAPRVAGTGTSSSGGSGSTFGVSGLPGGSAHAHKRKGGCRDDSDSRSEDAECEATEETKSSRRSRSKRRSRAAEVHNLSERKRRDRINEKLHALQELIPHCNKTDKASILDETIEYLKSLQMQVQIMWMTSGMVPMMFPGAHQFMSPMATGMNSACSPAAQGLSQMPTVPYINHPLPNHIPLNSSAAMNPLNVVNQMQNNHFLPPDGGQTTGHQVPGPLAFGPQIAYTTQHNRLPEVPASTVVPTSRAGQLPTYDGV